MQYTHYDLGHQSGGEFFEISLQGTAANVRLMDSSNFQSFKSGGRHTYQGGHFKQSPVRLQVPSSGHWYIVVDLGGYQGSVKSSVRQLS
jgi:hypothetical protein